MTDQPIPPPPEGAPLAANEPEAEVSTHPRADPGAAAAPPPSSALAFTPVPVRPRRDGWTVEKQRAFIRRLAETGVVAEAARYVGMSERSAHRLAQREDAEQFSEAWDAALRIATRPAVSKLYE